MMKTLTTRILSFILALVMTFTFVVPGLAYADFDDTLDSEGETDSIEDVIESEDIEVFKEIFENLSPEAKVIFEESLKDDPVLLAIHVTYVNPEMTSSEDESPRPARVRRSSKDPLKRFSADLKKLGLPKKAAYSLNAMAANMIAAEVENQLTVASILVAAAAAEVVSALSPDWSAITPQWKDIRRLFENLFESFKENIREAFGSIRKDIEAKASTIAKPNVQVNGQKVRVDSRTYVCTEAAEHLDKKKLKEAKYFPALLAKNTVYVDVHSPLTTGEAKIILYADSKIVGLWATQERYARGICGGNQATYHDPHGGDGFFPHYHHFAYKKCHCWYSNFAA